jgi:hypothetical protein
MIRGSSIVSGGAGSGPRPWRTVVGILTGARRGSPPCGAGPGGPSSDRGRHGERDMTNGRDPAFRPPLPSDLCHAPCALG